LLSAWNLHVDLTQKVPLLQVTVPSHPHSWCTGERMPQNQA
jgi:hypothetical protein